MDEASIYRKTDKGRQEVVERASGLAPQARRLLILIDGRRDGHELSVYVRPGELESALGRLLDERLVEAVAETGAGRVARAPAANDPVVFAEIKIRAMTEIRSRMRGRLAPMADMLIGEINACPSALALREKLRSAEDALVRLMGEEGVALARRIGGELTRLVP